jgi:thiol:disulfide interchange protein
VITVIGLGLLGSAATSLILVFFPQPWISRLGNLIIVVAGGAGCGLFLDTLDFRFAAISIGAIFVGGALIFVPAESRERIISLTRLDASESTKHFETNDLTTKVRRR